MRHAVIVSPDPDNPAGGTERMCTLLAEVLRGAGWQVSIVGPERGPKRWQFRIGVGYLVSSRSATLAARALNPDLLVTNNLFGMGSFRCIPRIHVYHGTMVGNTAGAAQSLSRRERIRRTVGAGLSEAIAGRGATVVCVSEGTAKEVRRFYRVKTDAVIPNGIDTTVFRPRSRRQARENMGLLPDASYCMFVGRMDYGKGADLLVAACREANFNLLIAGSQGAPGAHHLGVLAPESLADAYSAVDCVLFPSRYEACSYVVLEALACGVPLLTTRVGWVPSFLRAIPEYEALCVRPTHEDIVARLRQLKDLDTAGLTLTARKWVEKHNSLECYAKHWRRLLEDMEPSILRARQAK